MIQFTCAIIGNPETQGSIRAFANRKTGRAILTSDNARLKSWRKIIELTVRDKMRIEHVKRIDSACKVSADFILPRLSSHPKTSRGAEPVACTRPDLDKLMRALGDGMCDAELISEDSRIVAWSTRKRYAGIGESAGILLRVECE